MGQNQVFLIIIEVSFFEKKERMDCFFVLVSVHAGCSGHHGGSSQGTGKPRRDGTRRPSGHHSICTGLLKIIIILVYDWVSSQFIVGD